MTLIELTVGIVVTGLVVSAGYAAFSTIIDQRDRAAQVAAATAHSVGIRQTIFHWLDGARPFLNRRDRSNPQAVYELCFTTHAMTPMRALTTEIRLFIDNGSSGYGRGLVAVFRPIHGLSEVYRKDSIRVVLDSAARALVIDYLTIEDGTRQWRTRDYIIANPRPMLGGTLTRYPGSSGNRQLIATRLRVISDDPLVSAAFADPVVAPITMGFGLE